MLFIFLYAGNYVKLQSLQTICSRKSGWLSQWSPLTPFIKHFSQSFLIFCFLIFAAFVKHFVTYILKMSVNSCGCRAQSWMHADHVNLKTVHESRVSMDVSSVWRERESFSTSWIMVTWPTNKKRTHGTKHAKPMPLISIYPLSNVLPSVKMDDDWFIKSCSITILPEPHFWTDWRRWSI